MSRFLDPSIPRKSAIANSARRKHIGFRTKKKKILITGAGGHVGATLVAALEGEYDVVGYGHLPRATAEARGGTRSPKATEKRNGVKMIVGDISDYKKLSRAAEGAYALIHTAGPARYLWCNENQYEALRAIVYGTRNVRLVVEEHSVPLLIHLSSQAVYSLFKKRAIPIREDIKLEPDTLYGVLKRAAEDELSKSRAVIIRSASIYGVGNGNLSGNVVHSFAQSAAEGKPFYMTGDGRQKFDAIHVNDLVRLVSLILKKRFAKKDLPIVLNAGSGTSIPVREILEIAQEHAIERNLNIIPRTLSPGDQAPENRGLSIARARKLFGWKPEIRLEDGIKELIEFLLRRHNAGVRQ